jgi:hypothetical protein
MDASLSASRDHRYHLSVERPDGSVRIAWQADGFEAIDVYARWRSRSELERFAREVADAALFNRTVRELHHALRTSHPGEFELVPYPHDRAAPRVVVRLNPPRGEPNPDPY